MIVFWSVTLEFFRCKCVKAYKYMQMSRSAATYRRMKQELKQTKKRKPTHPRHDNSYANNMTSARENDSVLVATAF